MSASVTSYATGITTRTGVTARTADTRGTTYTADSAITADSAMTTDTAGTTKTTETRNSVESDQAVTDGAQHRGWCDLFWACILDDKDLDLILVGGKGAASRKQKMGDKHVSRDGIVTGDEVSVVSDVDEVWSIAEVQNADVSGAPIILKSPEEKREYLEFRKWKASRKHKSQNETSSGKQERLSQGGGQLLRFDEDGAAADNSTRSADSSYREKRSERVRNARKSGRLRAMRQQNSDRSKHDAQKRKKRQDVSQDSNISPQAWEARYTDEEASCAGTSTGEPGNSQHRSDSTDSGLPPKPPNYKYDSQPLETKELCQARTKAESNSDGLRHKNQGREHVEEAVADRSDAISLPRNAKNDSTGAVAAGAAAVVGAAAAADKKGGVQSAVLEAPPPVPLEVDRYSPDPRHVNDRDDLSAADSTNLIGNKRENVPRSGEIENGESASISSGDAPEYIPSRLTYPYGRDEAAATPVVTNRHKVAEKLAVSTWPDSLETPVGPREKIHLNQNDDGYSVASLDRRSTRGVRVRDVHEYSSVC